MKYNQLSLITLSFLLTLAIACSKKTDSVTPVEENPPVNNKPNDTIPTSPSTPRIVLTDFYPVTAYIGDTITVTGDNLDVNAKSLQVIIGNTPATIVSISKNKVLAIVPDDILDADEPIDVSSADTTVHSTKNFQLKAPVITSISHKTGFSGQVIEITGKGFRNSTQFDQVTFGNQVINKSITVPGRTTLQIPVLINVKAGQYAIAVTVAGLTAVAADSFTVLVTSITAVTPTNIKVGSEMIINGENFVDVNGSVAEVSLYNWGSSAARIAFRPSFVSNNQLKFTIPVVPAGNYRIQVRVLGSTAAYADPITITNP